MLFSTLSSSDTEDYMLLSVATSPVLTIGSEPPRPPPPPPPPVFISQAPRAPPPPPPQDTVQRKQQQPLSAISIQDLNSVQVRYF